MLNGEVIWTDLKWTQYNELVKIDFSRPQALQLVKDGFKM